MNYVRGLNEIATLSFEEVDARETKDENREPNYGYEHQDDARRDFEQTPNKLMMIAIMFSFMISFWFLVFMLIKFLVG